MGNLSKVDSDLSILERYLGLVNNIDCACLFNYCKACYFGEKKWFDRSNILLSANLQQYASSRIQGVIPTARGYLLHIWTRLLLAENYLRLNRFEEAKNETNSILAIFKTELLVMSYQPELIQAKRATIRLKQNISDKLMLHSRINDTLDLLKSSQGQIPKKDSLSKKLEISQKNETNFVIASVDSGKFRRTKSKGPNQIVEKTTGIQLQNQPLHILLSKPVKHLDEASPELDKRSPREFILGKSMSNNKLLSYFESTKS